MSAYHALILQETGCKPEDVAKIETIMRDDILRSTLDWQSQEELSRGARDAFALFQENHAAYEEYFDGIKRIFESSAKGAETQ